MNHSENTHNSLVSLLPIFSLFKRLCFLLSVHPPVSSRSTLLVLLLLLLLLLFSYRSEYQLRGSSNFISACWFSVFFFSCAPLIPVKCSVNLYHRSPLLTSWYSMVKAVARTGEFCFPSRLRISERINENFVVVSEGGVFVIMYPSALRFFPFEC